jgi:two-component system, OmpR family, phosphate regulon response regulator PhoB
VQKILLVDDEILLSELVTDLLGGDYLVSTAATLKAGRRELENSPFDLVLLDLTLPDGDGFKLCSWMQERASLRDIPVIFLTGRSDVEDKILAFSVGADDYIVKPFEPRELKARVRSRLQKMNNRKDKDEVFQKENLRFHVLQQKVFLNTEGHDVHLNLTPLEFRCLLFFARHEDHVLSRDQLLSAAWGEQVNVLDRTVDAHVSNLRKKLEGSPFTIRAVHKVGYKFVRALSMPKAA